MRSLPAIELRLQRFFTGTYVLIAYASSIGPDEPANLCSISQPLLLATEKRNDADEDSGPTMSLLRRRFCCY